jgi:NADPH-dependent curcumin reductase CurA
MQSGIDRQGVNRQVVLARRPVGMVDEGCFEQVEGAIPTPGDGQALIRVVCVAIDPAIRGWIDAKGSGYLPALGLGEPVRSNGVGLVLESRSERLPVGSLVTCLTGWQEYALACGDFSDIAKFASPLPEGTTAVAGATVMGQAAVTAYAGVTRTAPPFAGETWVVSAAASAVGSLVVQLARLEGARVVGIAGSREKCDWVVRELGAEACIDYKREDVDARLKALCPKGVNVYFDNVGGPLLDVVLRRIAHKGRIVLCGTLATDNADEPHRLRNYDRLMSRRATMTGLNVMDHWDLFPEALKRIGEGLAAGTLTFRTEIVEGLEHAPRALVRLYHGDHLGKLVVTLAQTPGSRSAPSTARS